MDTSVTAVTVNVVEPDTVPSVALTVVVPALAEFARPLEPLALLIVATDGFPDCQVTVAVRSCVEASA